MKPTSLSQCQFVFPESHWEEPLVLTNPVKRIVARTPEDVGSALNAIDEYSAMNRYYLAGYVAYETGRVMQGLELKSSSSTWPLIDFYVFEGKSAAMPRTPRDPSALFDFSSLEDYSKYCANIESVHSYLTRGHTYQVNYTFQNLCRSTGSAYGLFEKLRRVQQSRYSAFVQVLDGEILSLSPELFFLKTDNKIVTKPMKGTLPLGVKQIPEALEQKLRAENLMIVDLLRNDLARVALPESVRVAQLMEIEQYATLQQIVSTIEGEVEPDVSFSHILKMLFPCGSITGAPKRRTMEIIDELEAQPRGIYTGTIGYITPDADMQFSVAIRTLVGRNNQWSYGVGGGIVYDSTAREEYDEALLKGRFLKATNTDFSLFETMCWEESNSIAQLSAHLQRMKMSAITFGFPWNEEALQRTLTEALAGQRGKKRVHLRLFHTGEAQVEVHEFPASPFKPKVAISRIPMDSKNIFLRHKTTLRAEYEKEYEIFQKDGFYDVLFMNEKSQITEGSRHNIFILKDGHWLTPPLDCGLLPGVQRMTQIKLKSAREQVLTEADVLAAEQVVLTNALRGAVVVEVRP